MLNPCPSADRLHAYALGSDLGHGGMGVVYLAEDPSLMRKAALKVMNLQLAQSAGGRERFLREAQSAGQLRHENIVTVYEVGDEGGMLFLAMEYLQGESLEE